MPDDEVATLEERALREFCASSLAIDALACAGRRIGRRPAPKRPITLFLDGVAIEARVLHAPRMLHAPRTLHAPRMLRAPRVLHAPRMPRGLPASQEISHASQTSA
jgi:hypothetical protein